MENKKCVRAVPKSNRKIVETETKLIPLTYYTLIDWV